MPKKYCPSCGFGTEFSLTQPNFCEKCGGGYGVQAVASKKTKKRREIVEDDDEDYEDDETDDDVEEIKRRFPKKLKFTVDPIPQLHKESLANLGGPSGLGSYRSTDRLSDADKERKKQQILQNMRSVERKGAANLEE